MRTKTAHAGVLLLLTTLSTIAARAQNPALAPLPPLPTQHIVFVIDNSGSMEGPSGSDPLRLRGVAASLVLDAVELSSNVEAGLVFFSDRATTDGKLHSPDDIRRKLQAGKLPKADGGTNMAEGLEQALAILGSSTAPIRRIVLISDGMPDDPTTIITSLVPHASRAGIQIFALGVSTNIDEKFLDAVTLPTGGKTLIADHHQKLLQMAKELVGDLDNVYTLAKDSLNSTTLEREFTVPADVDRARLTLILDQPTEFAPGEIEFTLGGPIGFSEQTYTIEPESSARVAAWTAFFSAPGTYRLRVRVTKAGAQGHRGLHLFVEALSSLRIQLVLNPSATQYDFNQQVGIVVEVATAKGPVAPADATVSGEVQTAGGGSTAIALTDFAGTFTVSPMPGRQKIIVRVRTALSRAETRFEFTALPPRPPLLKATPEKFAFDPPLTAAHPDVEESFKLFAEFPQGTSFRTVSASFSWVVPAGAAELTANGAAVRPAPAQYAIPAGGLELKLRIRMDATKPLPKPGTYAGQILVTTKETADLSVPFELEVSVPEFTLKHELQSFSLWWDPAKTRTVHLGTLQTNLSTKSTFVVTIPEAINDPKAGKIADLALRVDGKTPESEPIEAGKLRYGPLDLPPGGDVRLELVVTPDASSGWAARPINRELQIRIASDLGMTLEAKPIFHNPDPVKPPLVARRSLHGVTVASLALLLLGGAIIALRTWGQLQLVARFWRYRPGCLLPLGFGPIQIGDGESAGALLLPNHGSELDDRTLGYVRLDGRQQRVENSSGYLECTQAKLAPGDMIRVKDPEDEEQTTNVWELEYVQYEPGVGGEVAVQTSPGWTAGRMIKSLLISAVVLWALHAALQTDPAASLAYRLPWLESLYTR